MNIQISLSSNGDTNETVLRENMLAIIKAYLYQEYLSNNKILPKINTYEVSNQLTQIFLTILEIKDTE